jgi:hypothetical protein
MGQEQVRLMAQSLAAHAAAADAVGRAQLIAALESDPAAVDSLIELLIEDSARDDADPAISRALLFMFEHVAENLRIGVERGDPDASAQSAALRHELLTLCVGRALPPHVVLEMVDRMSAVGLDPGGDLPAVAMAMLEDAEEALCLADDQADVTDEDTISDLDKVAMAHRDCFQLFAALSEPAGTLFTEQRAAFAALYFRGEERLLRDAGVGWLLDPAPQVRCGVAAALLSDPAAPSRLSATALRRLTVLRDWLPPAERSAIDAVIKAAGPGAAAPPPAPSADIRGVYVSACDGNGAQTVMLDLQKGDQSGLGGLMFKHGFGLKDAWVMRAADRRQVDALINTGRTGAELMPAPLSLALKLAAHCLAVGAAGGSPPTFGLLDVLETLGIAALPPRRIDLAELLAELADGAPADAADPDQASVWLKKTADWPSCFMFAGAWCDDDAEIAEPAGQTDLSRENAVALALAGPLEKRRLHWAEIIAWSGLALRESERLAAADRPAGKRRVLMLSEEWPVFAVAARELAAGRALAEIPVMRDIAGHSVDVFRAKSRTTRRRF